MELNDKAILVTGASRGLGRALAMALANAGARLVLTARREGPLAAVVDEVRAAAGEAHALVSDVGDADRAAEIAARAAALVGGIDVVIHNASTLGDLPMPELLDTTAANLERVFAVNTIGPFALTRVLVGSMLVRGGGAIVHITSDAAVAAYPAWGPYGASKAALDHMARTWAAELDGTPVRVLSVDPGEMDTAMHRDAMPGADRSRLPRPERVAARILELLQDEHAAPSGARLSASPPGEEVPR